MIGNLLVFFSLFLRFPECLAARLIPLPLGFAEYPSKGFGDPFSMCLYQTLVSY